MRKWVYSLAAVLTLAACNNESTKQELQTTQQKEFVTMNEAIIGKWQGLIDIPQMPLEVILDLQKDDGTLSVPAQNLSDFAFESVQYDNDQLNITIDLASSLIKIAGTFKNNQIDATFTQNGQTFPLVLTPFTEAAITYEALTVPVMGGELKIVLQMPDEPTGELVIIHAGSGPTNKDGNTIGSGKNDSLKMLAEDLAVQGIASVRFDKRGIGENTALVEKEEDLTLDAYVQDVTAIVDAYVQDTRFTSMHLIGQSEGALIMTLAAQKREITSLTLLAGAGRPVDEILIEQLATSLSPTLLTEATAALEKLKAGQTVSVSPDLQALFRASVQPYMMSWLKYDPQQELATVTAPVLIIQGKQDIQITETDAKVLQAANTQAQVRYFDHMNHVLKDITGDRTANIASYTNPDLPLAAGLIDEIVKFIR